MFFFSRLYIKVHNFIGHLGKSYSQEITKIHKIWCLFVAACTKIVHHCFLIFQGSMLHAYGYHFHISDWAISLLFLHELIDRWAWLLCICVLKLVYCFICIEYAHCCILSASRLRLLLNLAWSFFFSLWALSFPWQRYLVSKMNENLCEVYNCIFKYENFVLMSFLIAITLEFNIWQLRIVGAVAVLGGLLQICILMLLCGVAAMVRHYYSCLRTSFLNHGGIFWSRFYVALICWTCFYLIIVLMGLVLFIMTVVCQLQLCGAKLSEGVFVGSFLSMSSTAVVITILRYTW